MIITPFFALKEKLPKIVWPGAFGPSLSFIIVVVFTTYETETKIQQMCFYIFTKLMRHLFQFIVKGLMALSIAKSS